MVRFSRAAAAPYRFRRWQRFVVRSGAARRYWRDGAFAVRLGARSLRDARLNISLRHHGVHALALSALYIQRVSPATPRRRQHTPRRLPAARHCCLWTVLPARTDAAIPAVHCRQPSPPQARLRWLPRRWTPDAAPTFLYHRLRMPVLSAAAFAPRTVVTTAFYVFCTTINGIAILVAVVYQFIGPVRLYSPALRCNIGISCRRARTTRSSAWFLVAL